LETAKEAALKLYYEVDAHIQNKLPATTRKFKDVAQHTINRMKAELRESTGKQAYKDCIGELKSGRAVNQLFVGAKQQIPTRLPGNITNL
tara:strand:+ start:208 stop:477 length:270 start_codon:yes stop_codon:yes gene_type:complete